MQISTSILTNNPCYKAGKQLEIKGIMLHSVGCPQPRASAFLSSWNNAEFKRACVHAFIDGNTGVVYQTLPWYIRGWHCGSSGNNTHIGVEMCEPSNIVYTGGANFTCFDIEKAKEVVNRTYKSAVELFAFLCNKYELNPLEDGVIISHSEGSKRGIASNHADPEHLWKGLGLPYTMDTFRKDVKEAMGEKVQGTRAIDLMNYSNKDLIEKVGLLCSDDMKESGILASVTMAQFILESGYAKSELAREANNCFGMKTSLSGNTWSGSSWDGISVYTKKTSEQNYDGSYRTITADFRKYSCIEDSIKDHSAYLNGALKNKGLRYQGLSEEKDYRKAAQIIKDGGYATSLTYVDKLCSIIEKYNLTRFDGDIIAQEIKSKSIDDIAREVIKGLWGNGSERKARLEAAGYDYKTVQARVNILLK